MQDFRSPCHVGLHNVHFLYLGIGSREREELLAGGDHISQEARSHSLALGDSGSVVESVELPGASGE